MALCDATLGPNQTAGSGLTLDRFLCDVHDAKVDLIRRKLTDDDDDDALQFSQFWIMRYLTEAVEDVYFI